MKINKRILLIDDKKDIRVTFKAYFKDSYEIFTAASAEEGLGILNSTDIQVIICDQDMPKTTGTDFFASILSIHPKPIRILLTALKDHASLAEAINKAKVVQYIAKPWSDFDMRIAIENAIRLYYEANSEVPIKNKIFISHSSKDSKIVRAFVDNVLKLGLHINDDEIFCTSIEEATIKTGANFREVIKSELINSKAVIQIITKNYKESEVCLNEMGAAWVLNNNVIPFILEPVIYSNVGFIHTTSQLLRLNDKNDIFKFVQDFRGNLFDYDINLSALTRYIDGFVDILNLVHQPSVN